MCYPQIKEVAHVSRWRPGVSGRVVNQRQAWRSWGEEAGKKHTQTCQTARRPIGPTVRTQSSKWSGWPLARVRVRWCVRTLQYSTERHSGTWVPSWRRGVAGLIDPMTSHATPRLASVPLRYQI